MKNSGRKRRRKPASTGPLWQDLIPSTDPRYESWLLLRASLQREDSAARADLLNAFDKNGCVESADLLKFIRQQFDAGAKAFAATVTGVLSAEQRTRDLEEHAAKILTELNKHLPAFLRIPADVFETEAKLHLAALLESWKAEVLRIGLEREISKAKKVRAESESPTGTKRLQSTITSPIAARRMENYMKEKGIGQTEFAIKAGTTGRTLLSFRKTGKIKRTTLDTIAGAMGVRRDALLERE